MSSQVWVHRFPIFEMGSTENIPVQLPRCAEILYVSEQHDTLAMWFRVKTEAISITRYFSIVGTGSDVRTGAIYIGTGNFRMGNLILHLFEV